MQRVEGTYPKDSDDAYFNYGPLLKQFPGVSRDMQAQRPLVQRPQKTQQYKTFTTVLLKHSATACKL